MKVVDYFNTNNFIVSSELFNNGDFRLNSDYYEALLTSNNFHQTETVQLRNIAHVSHPGITKRSYIDNKEFGIPFLSTSDMQFYEATDNKYVSKELSKNLADYIVSEGTILISRSGTIGSIALVDKNMNGCAVTEHAIRVTIKDPDFLGLVYTFLNSDVGQKIIKGQKSGAVIDEIYDEDIEQIEIPIIDKAVTDAINFRIKKVKENRETAYTLINKARALALKHNNLPPIEEADFETMDPQKEAQIGLINILEFTEDFRLDAHFYNPLAKAAIGNIKKYSDHFLLLSDVSKDIIIGKRFKRNYVSFDHGTPFIGSKNILQIRPTELKHLSNTEIGFMDDLMLQNGMILIACSGSLGGTFGKACLVHNNFEKYAASQHILRIVCNQQLVDPGYLYAFLSSDYGYACITRYRWGALIDELDDNDMSKLIIPIPSKNLQSEVGDLVRRAYDLRAEAIRLEDEAQAQLTQELTKE
jgi:type I restriction enzyme, S subunit